MVKISKIDIKNFKFYIDDSIDISEKNFLIYGENGVGKSSLYLALYYLFYAYFDENTLYNIQKFKNRSIEDIDINLSIKFSNDETINIDNSSIVHNTTIVKKENIYFLDYRFLENLIDSNNLFVALENISDRFLIFDNIFETVRIQN